MALQPPLIPLFVPPPLVLGPAPAPAPPGAQQASTQKVTRNKTGAGSSNFKEAMNAAKKFQKVNEQLKLHIVGSLARKEPHIKDLDFVTTLRLPNNKKYFRYEFQGFGIDIWQVPNLAIGKFMRTVDKEHLIALHKGLKKNGYKLTMDGLFDPKGNKILFSPKGIWKLAEVKTTKYGGISAKQAEPKEKEEKDGFKKLPTKVQAVLFDRNTWTLKDAEKWFKLNKFTLPPGKLVHQTDKFLRFRVHHPDYKKYFHRKKEVGKGITFIIAIPK